MKPEEARQSIAGKQQQLDELRSRLPLYSNPEFMRYQEAKRRRLDLYVYKCTHVYMSEFEWGGLQGALHELEDVCMSREEAERKCHEVESEIRGLQETLQQAQDSSFREPPPGGPPPLVPPRATRPPGYPERRPPPGMYPEGTY